MRRVLASIAIAVAATVVLSACGTGTSVDMTPDAANELGNAVKDIRASIERGDRQGASDQLSSLKTEVAVLVGTGGITPARATRVSNAINALSDQLGAVPRPPSSTTVKATSTTSTSTTTSSTTTTDPRRGKGNKGD